MKLQHQLALAGRYIRTLRHLRFSQLRGQVITRLKKQWRDPAKILAGQPASWKLSLHSMELDLCPPVPAQDAEALSSGIFCFVNQTANLGFPVDWSAKGMSRLWSYNLHYFDWLWSFLDEGSKTEDERWESAKRLTHDWMINHPPSKTAEGWEPYPVSLRLINWSLLFGVLHRDLVEQDEVFAQQLLQAISRHVKWLELNLENHIQANHLLENLAALVCVACVFEGDEADRVLSCYLPRLNREIDEQFLADGMHYERSPMYHLRALWLVEMLGAVGSSEVQAVVLKVAGKMKLATAMLRHPDGEIALFNDAAHSIYNDAWKDNETELGSWALEDAGYYGFRDENENYLIVDAGPIGPDYQPGHAHADYLSFELSMHGNRMITDTGIASYDSGERRSYDRSTAAHSTVEIAGQNSAEVWGGFRVGRRVTPEVLVWVEGGEFQLKAKQTGYRYLPCQAEHTRRLKWCDGGLEIQDSIQARQETGAVSRLHFSPECKLTVGSGEVQIVLAGRQYRCLVEGDCEILLERHPSCLEFAMDEDRSVLVMKHRVGVGETTWKVRIEPALQAMAEE